MKILRILRILRENLLSDVYCFPQTPFADVPEPLWRRITATAYGVGRERGLTQKPGKYWMKCLRILRILRENLLSDVHCFPQRTRIDAETGRVWIKSLRILRVLREYLCSSVFISRKERPPAMAVRRAGGLTQKTGVCWLESLRILRVLREHLLFKQINGVIQ